MFGPKKKDLQARNEFNQYVKPISLWDDAWKRLKKNKMALISLFIVAFYLVVTMSAQLLTGMGVIYSNDQQVIIHQELPPSFMKSGELAIRMNEEKKAIFQKALDGRIAELAGGTESVSNTATDFAFGTAGAGLASTEDETVKRYRSEVEAIEANIAKLRLEVATDPIHNRVYLLGTDSLGRDMLARIIYGGQISILVGIIGMLTAGLIGIVVGSVAGYVGGQVDNLLMRFVDILYGVPYMIVVILIMVFIPTNDPTAKMFILFMAIAMVSWLTMSRVVRGQIISLKNSEFVEAARSIGASTPRIIFKHLLPNMIGVIIVFSSLMMPSFIMNESFLSFLGLGISAPLASWGTLVNEGVQAMRNRPWMLLDPAFAMTIFLFCMNFLGDGLRDAFDPQSKNRG